MMSALKNIILKMDILHLKNIESKTDSKLIDLRYFEEDEADSGATIRVYKDRTEVNLECVMEG